MYSLRKSPPTRPNKASCLFCFNAGKSVEQCSSHFLRSLPDRLSGVRTVTCPLLLNTMCSYCATKGHTPNSCPERIANNKNNKNNKNWTKVYPPRARKETAKVGALTAQNVNQFASLEENDRFHEPKISKNQQKKQEKKQKSNATNQVAGAKTWASIVSDVPPPVKNTVPTLSIVIPQTLWTADKPPVLRRETRLNWADVVDSDSDDDEAWKEQVRRTDEDSHRIPSPSRYR